MIHSWPYPPFLSFLFPLFFCFSLPVPSFPSLRRRKVASIKLGMDLGYRVQAKLNSGSGPACLARRWRPTVARTSWSSPRVTRTCALADVVCYSHCEIQTKFCLLIGGGRGPVTAAKASVQRHIAAYALIITAGLHCTPDARESHAQLAQMTHLHSTARTNILVVYRLLSSFALWVTNTKQTSKRLGHRQTQG